MRTQRIIRLTLALLTAGIFLVPQTAQAKIEAVKGKKYHLSKRHGPWMIMVSSISGENAEPAADALIYELRRKGIPAYSYHQKGAVEQIKTYDRFGRMRDRSLATRDDQISVIAGNYKSVDNRIAQKTLEYVKKMYPKTLTGGSYYKTPGRPLPLSGAFLTINPLLSPEEVAQREKDPLILKLNSGTGLSLLDNPGKHTLVVKTYQGKSITELASKFEQASKKFKVSNSLDQAAMDAWRLAKVLKSRGLDAYVFHDRYRSIVTVGAFNSEQDPQIRDLFNRFRAKVNRNAQTGREALSAEIITAPGPKKNDPPMTFIFDPTPQLMAVPKLR